jgi:ABC-type protease/lipase transport system fused ATPase/permease subunit
MMAIMTVAAILIITPEVNLSRGAMMASVILVGRVLMPIQSLVTGWSSIGEALEDYKYISQLLRAAASVPSTSRDVWVKPKGNLDVIDLGFHPDATPAPLLSNIEFSLKAGESLGIVGPSASGKSTLARLLV